MIASMASGEMILGISVASTSECAKRTPRSRSFGTRTLVALRQSACQIHHDGDVDSEDEHARDRKSTRLNSSHSQISYAVFCLKKNKQPVYNQNLNASRRN